MAKVKPVRGWVVSSDEIVVTNTTVDNVEGVVQSVLAGSSIDYGPIVGEFESQFVIRRILLWGWMFADNAATNLVGGLPVHLTLTVGNLTQLQDLAAATPMNNATWLENTNRFLRYEQRWVDQQSASSDFTAFGANMLPGVTFMNNTFHWDLSYKGGFNLQQDSDLCLGMGQGEDFLSWVNTDNVTLRWHSRVLLQKRRDG